MNRLLIAFLALAASGCTTPRAVVVEEPQKKPTAVARNSTEPNFIAPEIGLRDPDVISELPADKGLRSPTAVTSATPDGSPTVIARPPSQPAPGTPPASGAN